MGIAILIMNKKATQQGLSEQKLQNLESQVFATIIQKKEEKLNFLIEALKKKFVEICDKQPEIMPPPFERKEDFEAWFYLFHQAIHINLATFPEEQIFQHYKDEVLQILKATEDSFIEKAEFVTNFAKSLKNKDVHGTATDRQDYSPLAILTNPSLSSLKMQTKRAAWYKPEAYELVLNLLPTILGALGSMLIWCNSVPLFTKLFNMETSGDLLDHPSIPYLKMGFTFLFTFNFVFFYYYSQKKSLQREHRRESKKEELLSQEAKVVQMSQRLNLVSALNARIEDMMKFLEYSKIFNIIYKNESKLASDITSEVLSTQSSSSIQEILV